MVLPVRILLLTCVAAALLICSLANNVRIVPRNGEIGFAASRQKEYLFVTTFKLSWQRAVEHCRNLGMFLVSIQNQEEFDAVKAISNKSKFWKKNHYIAMWTSLNDIGEEGEFYWGSTGLRYTYDIWEHGEPNNKMEDDDCEDEDCVALVHHKDYSVVYGLDDRPCSQKYVFMCES